MNFLNVLLTKFMLLFNSQPTTEIPVVTNFNIKQFTGIWYETARYDHWFEKDMTDVYTKYKIIYENTISITNIGIKNNKEKIITGNGKFKNNPTEGWLRISFFWPFYSDYKIIYLDECYQTAIITSDNKNYLWILTRTDKLSAETKQQLITILKQFNFDTDKLIWSN